MEKMEWANTKKIGRKLYAWKPHGSVTCGFSLDLFAVPDPTKEGSLEKLEIDVLVRPILVDHEQLLSSVFLLNKMYLFYIN